MPDWLALRETADTPARASRLAAGLAAHVAGSEARATAATAPLRIVDLGAGTGAALRWLAPRLGGKQEWLLVDSDRDLLNAAHPELASWARRQSASIDDENRRARGDVDCETRGADRSEGCGPADEAARNAGHSDRIEIRAQTFTCSVRLLEADLAPGPCAVDWPERAIVSASALLDLVSADWLDALVEACAAGAHAAWLTLTYDGRIELDPADPLDERVRAALDRDQRRDKGFGPALGPASAGHAARAFAAAGFRVDSARSDWMLGVGQAALARTLIEGYADVARRADAASAGALEAWLQRRATQIARDALTIRVGHTDLLALPETRTGVRIRSRRGTPTTAR